MGLALAEEEGQRHGERHDAQETLALAVSEAEAARAAEAEERAARVALEASLDGRMEQLVPGEDRISSSSLTTPGP
jgi:hypothetical protein